MVTTKYGLTIFSSICKFVKVEGECSGAFHLPSEKTIRTLTQNNPCDVFLHPSAASSLNPPSAQEPGILQGSKIKTTDQHLCSTPQCPSAQEKTQLRSSSARATSALHSNSNQKIRIMWEERGE